MPLNRVDIHSEVNTKKERRTNSTEQRTLNLE